MMFRQGNLKVMARGDKIWELVDEQIPGVILVVSGMVRCIVETEGQEAEFFVGSGGAVGLIASLIGKYVPGIMPRTIYAEGNATGRGPIVLHIPW